MAKTSQKAEESPALGPGDLAPDFRLSSDDGTELSLSDFRGRKVVLYFYPKDDTPGCTKEACGFRDGVSRLTRKGAVVLGVSTDSAASHKKFKEKFHLNFPLLADTDRRVVDAYGVWKKKALYGRTFLGIVRTTFVIDEEGRIAKVFPKVKVDGHVDEVLAAL
jgi:thioredoxin-dependent peroxiredoxin